MLDDTTVYVFVRQDLEVKHQMVQSNHATLMMGMSYVTSGPGIPKLIVIGIPHIRSMNKLVAKLEDAGLTYFKFIDPDFPMWGVTAVATVPLSAENALVVEEYRLWNEKNNTYSGGGGAPPLPSMATPEPEDRRRGGRVPIAVSTEPA